MTATTTNSRRGGRPPLPWTPRARELDDLARDLEARAARARTTADELERDAHRARAAAAALRGKAPR